MSSNKKQNNGLLYNSGFTLVELLLVVSIIGILSGVVINVVNSDRQKKVAQDAVKKSTLDKLVTGVQSYYAIEGKYPVDESVDGNPMNDGAAGDDSLVKIYITVWPDNATDFYKYKTSADGKTFQIYIAKSTNSNNYFKYSSDWDIIKDCGSSNIDIIGQCSVEST